MMFGKILPVIRSAVAKNHNLKQLRNFGSNYKGGVMAGPATVNVSKTEIMTVGFLGMGTCLFVVYYGLFLIPIWRGPPVIH